MSKQNFVELSTEKFAKMFGFPSGEAFHIEPRQSWRGAICEFLWKVQQRRTDPLMTRFVAVELAKDHYFDISAARLELGYSAKVSMSEAFDLTICDLKKRGY